MSQSGFRRRFSQGLLANGYSQVATILIQIAQLPIILHLIGGQGLGVWAVMMSLYTFLSLSGLSVFISTGNEMMMLRGRGENEGARKSLSSGWAMTLALSVGFCAVVVACSPFVDWQSVVQSKAIPNQDLIGFAVWMAIATVFALQSGMVDAMLRASNRYAFALSLQTTQRIAEAVFGVGLLFLTKNLAYYGVGLALAKFVGFGVQYYCAVRIAPELRPSPGLVDWSHGRKLIKPGVGHSAIPASFAVELDGFRLSLAQGMGSAVIATNFTTMRTLGRMVWQLVYALGNTLWVELSQVLGRGDIDRARSLHRKIVRLAVWASLVAVLVLGAVGQPIYELWLVRKHTDGGYVYIHDVFLLILAAVFMKSFWSISYMVPISVNKATRIGSWFFGISLVTAIAGFFASRQFGLIGAAWILLAMEFVLIWVVWHETLPMLEEDLGTFLKYVLTPPFHWFGRVWRRVMRWRQAT